MKYNLENAREAEQADEYFSKPLVNKSIIEIKKVSPKRSLNQNNYLHLILSAFGNHFGYTLEEVKEIYKQLNKPTYQYTKTDRTFWKSSKDLTTEEMARTIDKFMQFSIQQGYALPPATDQEWLRRVENDIETSKYYLSR